VTTMASSRSMTANRTRYVAWSGASSIINQAMG
jgi:hypothetical protein